MDRREQQRRRALRSGALGPWESLKRRMIEMPHRDHALNGLWVRLQTRPRFPGGGVGEPFDLESTDKGELWWRLRLRSVYRNIDGSYHSCNWIVGPPGQRVSALWTPRSQWFESTDDLLHWLQPRLALWRDSRPESYPTET